MVEIETASAIMMRCFADGEIDSVEAWTTVSHWIRLLGGGSHALGRVNAHKRVQLVRGTARPCHCCLRPAATWRWRQSRHGQVRCCVCVGATHPPQQVASRPLPRSWRPGVAIARQRADGPGRRRSDTLRGGWPAWRCSRKCCPRGMLEVLPRPDIRGSLHDLFVIVDEDSRWSAMCC